MALIAHDLHSAWLNTEAMRRLDVGPGREDPAGGEVERDDAGRPTGVLKERALDWWYEGRPRAGEGARRAAVLRGQAELHRVGVTGVHSVEGPESFRLLEGLAQSGELRLRVLHHMPQRFLGHLIACGVVSGFGGAWLRVGGIKYFTDGALGSHTAWMLDPYADVPGRSIRRLAPGELSNDVERAARAGVVASVQPSHLLTDIPLAERRWGAERSRWTLPLRSLLEAGTVLAFGSDAPVEAADPREGFYGAVARRDRRGYPPGGWYAEEQLTAAEVLRAYTEGPARAAGEVERSGRLAPGFRADFAAWQEDPVTAETERLRSLRVVATVVGGELVYGP